MNLEIKVLMFGITAVGKTSLLASMFYALQENPVFAGLVISSEKSHELGETVNALKKYIRTLGKGQPEGIPGTASKKSYTFQLALSDDSDSLSIIFTDMPGEWLDDPGQKEEWKTQLKENDFIINVISAPAMMEYDREYNGDINKPAKFNEYLGLALNDAEECGTKQIFLVPVKCEKYIEKTDEIITTLQKVYYNIRVTIRNKKHMCLALPVCTLGTVIFDRIEIEDDGTPVDYYKLKNSSDTSWKPKNIDVIIAHILKYGYDKVKNKDEKKLPKVLIDKEEELKKLCVAKILEKHEQIHFKYACFSAETPIYLSNGRQIPISEIKPGTEILTLNRSGQFESQAVVKVSSHHNVVMMELFFDDSKLRVTKNHLFRVENGWKRADHLSNGCRIYTYEPGKTIPVRKKIIGISQNLIVGDAYNIYVKSNGSYIAGGTVVSSYVVMNTLRHAVDSLLMHFQKLIPLEVRNA